MSINGQAQEAEDFTTVTGVYVYATAGSQAFRSGYQRGALYQTTSDANAMIYKAMPSAKTTQCFTARMGGQGNGWGGATSPLFVVTDGGTPILGVWSTVTTGYLKIRKYNGSTWDDLATGAKPTTGSPIRLDMYVENYGASGRVRVWLREVAGVAPAVLWLDTGTVDISTTGHTSFDGIIASIVNPGSVSSPTDLNSTAAELIFADEPTMRLNLATIYPNAAGDTNTWDSGTYASVDELAADTGDFTESGTAGQLFLANVTDLPSTAETPQNVQVTVLAAKGTSGPTKIALAIKTHSTVYYSGEFSLTEAYAPYSFIWSVNPNTSAAWTRAEITALQIGYESRT